MPTADKKNFIVEKGIELEGGFKLKNVTATTLIDSAGTTSVLTDSSNSASIISAAGGNIVKGYDSSELLPLSNNTTGELNYVTETNRLYLWNGSGWYNIATVNTTPTMTTTPDSNYSMDSVGASLTITLVATDPEGLPITYSATSDSSSTFVTISQDSGVFTITPLTQSQLDSNGVSEGGTFSINFKASDGVNIVPNVTNFTLTLAAGPVTNSKYTSRLVTAVDTSDNNNIVDASSNSRLITSYDDTSAGTFTPYRHGGYSWYGSASGAYSTATIGTIGTNEFTIECWVYWPTVSGPEGVFEINTSLAPGNQTNTISVFTRSSTYSYNWAFATNGTQVDSSTAPTANTWHHVALVRDSNNLITLYIDGSSLISRTDSTSISATTLSIGRYYNTSFNVNGYIHDFRIVNGSAVYTSNFTPPTEKLTAITNTDLLAYRNGTFIDESTNSRFIFKGSGVENLPFTPYDNVPYAVDDHGGSIYFDGDGDYLKLATSGNSSVTDFTISFWMYPESFAVNNSLYPRVLAIGDGSSASTFILYIDTGLQMKLYTGGAVRIESGAGTSTVFRADNWQHIVLKRNSGTWRLLVNGTSQGTYSNSTGINFNSASMFVARSTSASGYYTGYISDFKIEFSSDSSSSVTVPTSPYSSSGTEYHIKGTEASIIDKAQGTNLVIPSSGVTGSTTQVKFTDSKSIYFSGGSSAGIDLGTNLFLDATNTEYTLEMWYYPTQTGSNSFLMGSYISSSTGRWLLYQQGSDSRIRFFANLNGTKEIFTSAVSANTWYHVALVRKSNGYMSIFLNGTETELTTDVSGYATVLDRPVLLGSGDTFSSSGCQAYIQDVRITKGLARYTSSFTPPSASLDG